jgi:hypothetical protein
VGWVLIVTAVLVLVPVALQLRTGEHGILDFAGYFLFASGLFIVGASELWLDPAIEGTGMLIGLGAVIAGLIVARPKRR